MLHVVSSPDPSPPINSIVHRITWPGGALAANTDVAGKGPSCGRVMNSICTHWKQILETSSMRVQDSVWSNYWKVPLKGRNNKKKLTPNYINGHSMHIYKMTALLVSNSVLGQPELACSRSEEKRCLATYTRTAQVHPSRHFLQQNERGN